MPITLISGPANAGKAQLVLEAVRRETAHGLEPLLVVPTRADTEQYLRELAGEGAVMGVRVQRFEDLIAEAVRRAGLSEPVLEGAARETLLAGILDDAHEHAGAGLLRALGELVAELRVGRVSAARFTQALARWAEQDGPGDSRAELGRLYGAYCLALERLGRVDHEQQATRALDVLRRTPRLWGPTPVAFYGFDDLTPLQIDAIETIGRVVGAPVTVSLTYEPGRVAFAGRAATFAGLAPLADEHRVLEPRAEHYAPQARAALSHLERSLFETGVARVDPGAHVRMLEGGGERAELELVAGGIEALLGDGVPAEEIAVVMRSPGASAALLEEVFADAGIPFALERRRRLNDTAIGRALLGLLRCLPPAAAAGGPAGTAADLLAWLRAPGLLERPEFADALELRVRKEGVRSASRARALWEERHWTLDTIDQLGRAAERGPGALIERVVRELQWLFAAPRRRAAPVLAVEEAEEARALSAARGALAELRELARAAPELAPADGPALARALERAVVFGGARPTRGMVAVLDPLALRARRVRALFLCCLQEGVFPARAQPEPLLSEDERRRLAETSGLRLGVREDPLAAERYLLYAAVSRPRELLVLSWHVADDEGEPTARSLFVDDLCDLLAETLSEQRLRRPLGAVESPGEPEPRPRLAGRGAVLADEHVLEALRGRPWSASSLERWIRCPMGWFIERMLDPGDFEPQPEPLARGGLAHAALADTLEGLRVQRGSACLTRASLDAARALLREALELGEADHPLSVAPERLPGMRRGLRADLERYLEYASEIDSPLEPAYLEVGFGMGTGEASEEPGSLAAFQFAPGAWLRGRIDRIDVSDAGAAVVYDYKSSFAPRPDTWVGEGKLQVALYMHAVQSLLGLRVAGGFYQPLSGADLRARGVLDSDSGVELDCVRGDAREHEDVHELLREAIARASEAAAEAGAGELEARPQTCSFGRAKGCAFPTICRCER